MDLYLPPPGQAAIYCGKLWISIPRPDINIYYGDGGAKDDGGGVNFSTGICVKMVETV